MRVGSIIGVCLFLTMVPSSVFAQELAAQTENSYQLPYPGVLPGQTLYPFKEIKESLQGFFIADPYQKAVFSLEQAEKYMQGAYLLFFAKEHSKENLTATLKKAAFYSQETFGLSQDASKQGKDGHIVIDRLLHLLEKQEELLDSMLANTPVVNKEEQTIVQEYKKSALSLRVSIYKYQVLQKKKSL